MDFYEYIDDFLNGALKGEELKLFQSEMDKDPALKKAVENHPIAKRIAGSFAEIEAEEILSQLSDSSGKEYGRRKFLNWALIAAAVLLLICTPIVLNLFNKGNNTNLALSYYNAPIVNSTRSVEQPTELLERGKYYFELRQFRRSDSIFTSLLDGIQGDDAQYFLGHSAFMRENYDMAKKSWSSIKEAPLLFDASYNLALIDIINKDFESARIKLILVGKSSSQKSSDAIELLAKL